MEEKIAGETEGVRVIERITDGQYIGVRAYLESQVRAKMKEHREDGCCSECGEPPEIEYFKYDEPKKGAEDLFIDTIVRVSTACGHYGLEHCVNTVGTGRYQVPSRA